MKRPQGKCQDCAKWQETDLTDGCPDIIECLRGSDFPIPDCVVQCPKHEPESAN